MNSWLPCLLEEGQVNIDAQMVKLSLTLPISKELDI